VDASGHLNGIALGVAFVTPTSIRVIGNASGSMVSGFTVENATQEGILALGSHFAIENNVVTHNDLGAFVKNAKGECAAEGETPGDCGEGIHLGGVTDSYIYGNEVTGNTGGILVSDELGPTTRNWIVRNTVVNNVSDCGITLAGHNGNAVSASGRPQPARGGVYHNWIVSNDVKGNGAAGIGMFAGGPGTGVYGNNVVGNTVSSNGLPGVAMHTHTPDADANGNRVVGNFFSHNALGIPAAGIGPGDPGTPVDKTTDIDVVADPGATPITGTVIRKNFITDVRVGIWLITSGHTQLGDNAFRHVHRRIVRG
jgi:nitrous oxidase accessory protein NosD